MAKKRKKGKQQAPGVPQRIRAGVGPACKRCARPMQRWEHPHGWKPQSGAAGYYLFWFECGTKTCQTKQVMPAEAYQRLDRPVRQPRRQHEHMPRPVARPIKTDIHPEDPRYQLVQRLHATNDGRVLGLEEMDLDHLYRTRSRLGAWARKTDDDDLKDHLWASYREIGRELGRRGIEAKAKRTPVEAEADRLAQEAADCEPDAVKECPSCSVVVAADALTCSECGHDWRSARVEAAEREAAMAFARDRL